jgi:vitamin B12 transporter
MSNSRTVSSFTAARALVLAAFISPAGSLFAQVVDGEASLPPVVVTASRLSQPQSDALPHTTAITAEDIRNSQAADLPSLLRREAGIQFTQNGGPGQSSSMFMRGATPGEALILIDGVPVRRQGFAPSPALEHILPEQIDHIEIVRGNVSAIYGSGAIGGVIQIFTKQGSGQPTTQLSAEVGSRGTQQLSGGVSGKSGDTRYALSLTRFRTDGFSTNNVAQYPNENPDRNGDRNTSFSGNVSHEWMKGHELGVRAYANDGKFTYDSGGFATATTDTNKGQSQQRSVAVFSKDRFAPNWMSTVTLSQTATRNENISFSAFGSTIRDNSDTSLLQWANEISLAPNWTLVGGLDAGEEKLDAFSDFGFGATRAAYHRSTNSLYAGLNGKIEAHQFQLNVRHDKIGNSVNDTTGFFGYGYELTPTVKLIANASTAFNAPDLTQIFDPVNGNRALASEKSKSYEAGAQYAAGASLVRATLFKTRTTNQFGTDPKNCTFTLCPTVNIAKASNEGLELSAATNILDTELHATLTLQSPKNDTTNQLLIRRARTLASLSLSKAFGPWRVGSDLQYAGSRPDTDFVSGSKKQLGAYWLANATARYQMTKSVSLYGRVENLFDRNYQTAYGYNQPPRGVFVGLNWQQ